MIIKINGIECNIEIKKNEKGIYEYYMQSAEPGEYILIGGYDPKVTEDKIIFKEKTLAEEVRSQIRDQLNPISEKQIDKEAELTKLRNLIEEYANENKNELERAIIIDRHCVEKKVNIEKKEDVEKDEEEVQNLQDQNKKKEIITTKDVTVKDEFSLSEPVDGVRSLKNTLGNIPAEYTKIGMIESDEMDEMKDENGRNYKKNSTRFDLVVINEKTNEIRPLREFVSIEQSKSYGDAPRSEEDSFLANNDGTANQNEKDDIQGKSIYQLKDIIIEIGQREHGDEVAYFAKRAHGERNFVGHELRGKNNVIESNRDERDASGEFWAGEYAVNRSLKEAEREREVHGRSINSERQTDGQERPVEEEHASLENIDEQLIEKMKDELKDKENVEEAFTDREIEEMIKDGLKERLQDNSKEDFDFDKMKEKIYKEIEEDASNMHIHKIP